MSSKYKFEKVEHNLFIIKPTGRGSVPKQLRGRYTSQVEAKKAVERLERTTNDSASSSRSK